METEILNSIIRSVELPIIILNSNSNIIQYNNEAERIFIIDESSLTLDDIFKSIEVEKIKTIINKLHKFNFPQKEILKFKLKSENELIFNIIVNSLKIEDEKFILISFNPNIETELSDKKIQFGISSYEIKELINNSDIKTILDDIKTCYPFTYLEKDKFQKKINNLSELFYIKDINNKFILVNGAFANIFGMNPLDLEGKNENNFFPQYILEFYNSINKYIKETLKYFIIDGIPIRGFTHSEKYQTILFPIIDSEKNVVALISISQIKLQSDTSFEKTIDKRIINILNKSNLAYTIFDENGYFKQVSSKFIELFELSDNIIDTNYKLILPKNLVDEISSFINDNKNEIEFIFDYQIDDQIRKLLVTINKNIDVDKNKTDYLLMVNPTIFSSNFDLLKNMSTSMYDTLIQNYSDPIFIYDIETLGFLEVNKAALDLYGYKRDEFLKLDLTDLYSSEDIQSLIETSISKEVVGKFEGPFKQKKRNGENILVEIKKIPFTFENKNSIINIIKNISDEIEKQKELSLYKTTFENTNDLILVTDNSGFIKYVNSRVIELLNYEKNDILGISLISLFKDEDRSEVNLSLFHSNLKTITKLKLGIKNSLGNFIPMDLTVIPILDYNGEIESFNFIAQPIVESMPQLTEVEKVKETKEEKILSAEYIAPNQISTIFHEILTPINVMIGFLQEIKDSLPNQTGEQQEAFNYINQNQSQLLDIMNSIAEYSQIQIDINQVNRERFFTTKLIDEIKEDFNKQQKKENRILEIEKVSTSQLKSDFEKLKSLINTILKIISKVSAQNQFYLSFFSEGNDKIILTIRDENDSISQKCITIFEKIINEKDYSAIREFELSRFTPMILTSLIGTLQGKFEIMYNNKIPFALRFSFPLNVEEIEIEEEMLPSVEIKEENEIEKDFAKQEIIEEEKLVDEFPKEKIEEISSKEEIYSPSIKGEETEIEAETKVKLDLSKLSCLYIEDQVDSQILFKFQMKDLKDIKFAPSFEEAFPLITSQHFDFILMDINLQGEYNGLDALKIIHNMPGYESLPIIAITAYVLPGDKEKFIVSGFNDFIAKPIFRNKIIESLEKIFSK